MNKGWFSSDRQFSLFIALFVLVMGFCGAVILVSHFAQLFPGGIYRYASIAFGCGVICVWVLMRLRPIPAIFLLLAILPLGARLSEFFKLELGELIITADVIAIWGAVLIYLTGNGLRRDSYHFCLAMFFGFVIVSSLVNLDSDAFPVIICGLATPLIAYVLIESAVKDKRGIGVIVNALGVVVIFCSLFAFAQPFINNKVDDFFYLRLPSVFYNPVIFAGVIILLWPFSLIYEPFGSGRLPTLTFASRVFGVGVALIALLLTGSRMAVVICGLQLLWIYIKFRPVNQGNQRVIRRATHIVIWTVLIAVIVNFDFLLETVLRRFSHADFSESGNSASERVLGALGGLEICMDNPFFGVGLGNFNAAYPFTSAAFMGKYELESAHNFLSNLMAEIGLIGTVLWLCIIFMPFRHLQKIKQWSSTRDESALYVVLQCSLAGFAVAQLSVIDEFMHKNVALPMILYFVVMGLAASLFFMQRKRGGNA